jgi:SAM-dependent methyltransferase
LSDAPLADPAWDSFWRFDRLSSFHAAPGAPNYGPPISDGWRAFFDDLSEGARILDLATGNGAIAVIAVEAGKRFTVTGADLASVEPTAFVTRNRTELEQVHFLAGTAAEALPLADASFDAVVSQYGIEYSDLPRSLAEAARVLAPGGRLRFACHAAEGMVAHDTLKAIADADFLLSLDLAGLAQRCRTNIAAFNAALRAIADRAPGATDVAMLANVHESLCEAYDHRRSELPDAAQRLTAEIAAHRARQAALLVAARTDEQMAAIGAMLEALGVTAVTRGEQRDGADLIGYTLDARRG